MTAVAEGPVQRIRFRFRLRFSAKKDVAREGAKTLVPILQKCQGVQEVRFGSLRDRPRLGENVSDVAIDILVEAPKEWSNQDISNPLMDEMREHENVIHVDVDEWVRA